LTDDVQRRYAALRARWFGAQAAQAAEGVEALTRTIDELALRLRVAARDQAVARRRLRVLDDVAAQDDAAGERDLDALAALPGVESVDVSDDLVAITTRIVRVRHEGRSIELGRYRIEIRPEANVLIHRVSDDGRRGWDHPHIQAARPCLGNLQVGVETLLGRMELAAAAALLLQFLESYDAETAYCPIEAWEQPVLLHAEARR
jgi:hypothetical protein